jgi:hypothetical protein
MTKTVVIHQPDLMPHLAYFHRLVHADLLVHLDTAQFVTGTSRSWMNRDRIKTRNGPRWITASVRPAHRATRIADILLSSDDRWRESGLNLIRENYRRAPCFDEIMPYVEELFRHPCEKMVDLNLKSIRIILDLLDIRIETMLASALDPRGRSNELLVDILKKVGGTRYLSGVGAKDYFDPEPFQRAGITVLWQEFNHPVYPQLFGEFVPYLSSIDLLFNCGRARSREILLGSESPMKRGAP